MAVRLWALRTDRPLPPRRFLVLISVRGWSTSGSQCGSRTRDLPAYSTVPPFPFFIRRNKKKTQRTDFGRDSREVRCSYGDVIRAYVRYKVVVIQKQVATPLHSIPSFKPPIANISAEDRTESFPNTSLRHYRYVSLFFFYVLKSLTLYWDYAQWIMHK
jgi:hypothetical protein